jgi:hypothetical protein
MPKHTLTLEAHDVDTLTGALLLAHRRAARAAARAQRRYDDAYAYASGDTDGPGGESEIERAAADLERLTIAAADAAHLAAVVCAAASDARAAAALAADVDDLRARLAS